MEDLIEESFPTLTCRVLLVGLKNNMLWIGQYGKEKS